MNDSELKRLWQSQNIVDKQSVGSEQLTEGVRKRMKKLDRALFWRDGRELAACALVIWWFGERRIPNESTLTFVGRVIVVASCLVIAGVLLYGRRGAKSGSSAVSVRESLLRESSKVERQIRMLNSVVWWYLLPLLSGCVLYHWGADPSLAGDVVYLFVCVVIGGVIAWVNRFAVKRTLTPIRTELQRTIESLEL